MKLNTVFLLLGSNMQDPGLQLSFAKKNIQQKIGNITGQSSVYRTAAWGEKDQPEFLNEALLVQSKLSALEILQQILNIEANMGRIRTEKNAPRLIDIDILFFNDAIIKTKDLIVPHPEISRRRFVLAPLAELAPLFIHPQLYKNIRELLNSCEDVLNVQKI